MTKISVLPPLVPYSTCIYTLYKDITSICKLSVKYTLFFYSYVKYAQTPLRIVNGIINQPLCLCFLVISRLSEGGGRTFLSPYTMCPSPSGRDLWSNVLVVLYFNDFIFQYKLPLSSSRRFSKALAICTIEETGCSSK